MQLPALGRGRLLLYGYNQAIFPKKKRACESAARRNLALLESDIRPWGVLALGNRDGSGNANAVEHCTNNRLLGLEGALFAAALSACAVAQAQTAAGPATGDSLTWHGITLYGTVDIGLQYETHGAPFSDYYTPGSTNIIQKNGRESVLGSTSSNVSQSKIGLKGIEPIAADWSGVFAVETYYNPQSSQLSDSLRSLTVNNGLTAAQQTTNNDGASAGQAFQIAYVGFSSPTFGTVTFGRQLQLVAAAINVYDPNLASPAYSLLGASGAYQGAGSTEDKRLDATLKYAYAYSDLAHFAALYKFNQANGSDGGQAFQADIGGQYAGFSIDGLYSRINDAVSASVLTATQVAGLAKLGYSAGNSVAATISDNTTLAVMASYQLVPVPVRFSGGYEHIQYANPTTPVAAGTTGLGGYVFAYVNVQSGPNSTYVNDKKLDVYWGGVRYTVIPSLDLTASYYGYKQNANGTGANAGCSTSNAGTCSGTFKAFSFDADYRFTRKLDGYAGIMYSGVSGGLSNGYLFNTTNLNPTIGVRYNF